MPKKCTTKGCKGEHVAHGLCRKCYDKRPDQIKRRNTWFRKQPKEVLSEIARRSYLNIMKDPERREKYKKSVAKAMKKYHKTERYKAWASEYSRKKRAEMSAEERHLINVKHYRAVRDNPVRWEAFKKRSREYAKERRLAALSAKTPQK